MEEQAVDNGPSAKMAQVDVWLDEFECKLGLSKFTEKSISSDLGKYLEMTRDQLEKLSPEQCAEIATVIAQASFHIQRAYNREVSHVTWAKELLQLGVAGKTSGYGGSFYQQEAQAIKGDDYLVKANKIKSFAQQRVDRLAFLATTLNKVGDKLENLQQAKNRKA